MDMKYKEKEGQAQQNSSRYTQGGGNVCGTWLQWDEAGINYPGGGKPYFEDGPSILALPSAGFKTDGFEAYVAAMQQHRQWVTGEPYGFNHCQSHGKGVSYSDGASISILNAAGVTVGVSFTVDTEHTKNSEQCIVSNVASGLKHLYRTDPYNGVNSDLHYLWGSDGKLIDNPRAFYNY